MSRPWRVGRLKIQSQGDWEGVEAVGEVAERRVVRVGQAEGGRPFAWFEVVTVEVGRMSWASLRPVRVEAKTEVEEPEGL
jgi:hypothetical protein